MASEIMTGEAARILGISVNHVRYLERTGQIPARRVAGMRIFQRDQVEQLAEERLRKATSQPHWRDHNRA